MSPDIETSVTGLGARNVLYGCTSLKKASADESYFTKNSREGIKIITPNIANIIANDVNIPNKTVGIKLEKLNIEKPNAIVIDVVRTAKPAEELVSFIESIKLFYTSRACINKKKVYVSSLFSRVSSIFSFSYLFNAKRNIVNKIVLAIRKVIGNILSSKAFKPSKSAGFGPLGA